MKNEIGSDRSDKPTETERIKKKQEEEPVEDMRDRRNHVRELGGVRRRGNSREQPTIRQQKGTHVRSPYVSDRSSGARR